MQELNTQAMRQTTRDKLDRLRALFEAESYQFTRISDWYDSLRKRGERFGNAQLSAWLGRSSYYTQDEYVRLAVTHAVHPSQIDKPIPFAVTPVQESLPMEERAVAWSEDDPVDPRVMRAVSTWFSSDGKINTDDIKRMIADALDANRVVIESMLDAKINSAIAAGLSAQNHYINSKLDGKAAEQLAEARDGLVAEAVADVLARIEAARFRLVPGGAS